MPQEKQFKKFSLWKTVIISGTDKNTRFNLFFSIPTKVIHSQRISVKFTAEKKSITTVANSWNRNFS